MTTRAHFFVLCAFALMGGALANPAAVNCTAPIEGLNIVATYDNSEGDQDHTFHYNEKVGTHFEDHGHPGQEELEGFFEAFAEILGKLVNHGDWPKILQGILILSNMQWHDLDPT